MTNTQIEFLHSLSNDELSILQSLFDDNTNKEAKNYINFMLEHSDLSFDKYRLSKEIPIYYLPIMDISFYYIARRAQTIGKYILLKRPICLDHIGPVKAKCIESALECFLDYMDEEIVLSKQHFPKGVTGQVLLDFNLSEKKEMITSQKKEIYDYLSSFNSPYVFSYKTDLDLYSVNQDKLIEILARYSHYDDLSSKNIESFKRFIRK